MSPRNPAPPFAALAAVLVACGPADFSAIEQPTEWTEVPGARWRSLAVEATGDVGFTPIPRGWTGITFANALTDVSVLENQMRTNGSGVAVGDVDGDGRPDIYLARLDGPNVLYRNLGNWRFEDATVASGLAADGRFSTGVTLVDVDGDRDLDLLLTSLGGEKSLYLNDGEGRFEASPDAGLLGPSGAMSIALADIDGDLDLDLYVTNYRRVSVLDLFSPEDGAFPNTVHETEDGFEVTEAFKEHYEIITQAGTVFRREKAEADELYLNDGTGRFRHIPFDSGAFLRADGRPLAEAPLDWGLSARFGDLDGDGDPDLYVANDLHSPDRIWINQGGGTFRAVSPWAIRTTSASSMAVDFSDVDRDGDLDIFVVDMLSRSSRLRKTQAPVARVEPRPPGDIAATQQVNRNTLLLNRGDGTFAEVANFAGVEASDWSWSALFIDVDLDGYEDLLIANGHIRDLMDADTQIRLRDVPLEESRKTFLLYDPLPLLNIAFRNRGDLTFEEVGESWGVAPEPDVSHGAALADFDGDGDLDLVMNRLDKPALVLRNDGAAARLAIRLVGSAPNTSAVGATIRVGVPGLPVQTKEVTSGGGYLSGSDALAAFALGSATEATIEVRWPGGARSTVEVDGANRLYEIMPPRGDSLGAGEATRAAGGSSGRPDWAVRSVSRWFELDPTFAPVHIDPPVDEMSRQPLLPFRLSQMGPSLAWHDLDGDGDPDLLIGSGAGSAPALFRNDEGTLIRVTLAGPNAPVDQTAIIPLPDGRGRIRIVLGLSSYEAPTAEAQAVPGAIGLEWAASALGGSAITPQTLGLIPGAASATGAIAMADYDGDGRLDLFIGGRVIPGAYPEPATSRVFRGRPGGGFEPDLRDDVFQGLGLVTGALFSDIDLDGDPDLVLATEWGPIRVLRNHRGRFSDVTAEMGLAGYTSRWNALAAGDFDGDGRPDLIATSWGENTEYRATADRPLAVYFGDVDRNGTVDVIEAQRDDRLRAEAPLAGWGRLSAGIPLVSDRLPTHARYAEASVEELVGALPAGRATVTGFGHTAFLNRGDRFEARPLPVEAQWSPSMGIVVADANGDGFEDVFLAQNFFATDEDSPRYDSGRGLWLEGDGKGGFAPVPADVSGVAVYGDQRGPAVADIDGDGRIDLVIGQNGGESRLYRNVGARPGLRVRLIGPAANPYGIGAVIRVAYGSDLGPAREIRAGSGTGSHDDPVQVLGLSGEPTGIEVRWPGGEVEMVTLEPGQRELTVRARGSR